MAGSSIFQCSCHFCVSCVALHLSWNSNPLDSSYSPLIISVSSTKSSLSHSTLNTGRIQGPPLVLCCLLCSLYADESHMQPHPNFLLKMSCLCMFPLCGHHLNSPQVLNTCKTESSNPKWRNLKDIPDVCFPLANSVKPCYFYFLNASETSPIFYLYL